MNRRLFYLNALLLLGAAGLGMRLRSLWLDARQAEEMVRTNSLRPPTLHAGPQNPQVQPVNAMNYSDVAYRMLFAKDRNPTVIEEPKVVVKPPDPPIPPFPKSYGVMLIGSEPKILMVAKSGEGQKIYKFGDKVGDFEIVKFDSRQITLKWMDKEIVKDLGDLTELSPIPAPAAVASNEGGGSNSARVVDTSSKGSGGYGDTIAGTQTKACVPGDTSPNGTVQDGMRKVLVANPFGNSCHWEPVK